MNPLPYLLLSSERINAETGHRWRRASSRPTKPPQVWYCGYVADATFFLGQKAEQHFILVRKTNNLAIAHVFQGSGPSDLSQISGFVESFRTVVSNVKKVVLEPVSLPF